MLFIRRTCLLVVVVSLFTAIFYLKDLQGQMMSPLGNGGTSYSSLCDSVDQVLRGGGLPNPLGFSAQDYLFVTNVPESDNTSTSSTSLATVEIPAAAYASIQTSAASMHFSKEEYPQGMNCLKTAQWALSDKDRAFTVTGGDLGAAGTLPPPAEPISQDIVDMIRRAIDHASMLGSQALQNPQAALQTVMNDLGAIRASLDQYVANYHQQLGQATSPMPKTAGPGLIQMATQDAALPGLSSAMSPFPSMSSLLPDLMNTSWTSTAAFYATNESSLADASSSLDPVILYSGEFRAEAVDLKVPSVGVNFEFRRIYRNQWERDSSMGYNWTHNYEQRLIFNAQDEQTVLFKDADGQAYAFRKNESGEFAAPYQVKATLTQGAQGYELRYRDGTVKRFDDTGLVTAIEDRHGNVMTFAYDRPEGQALLHTIQDTQGRTYELSYAGGRIKSLKDPFGRIIKYTYDGFGNLDSVRGPATSAFPHGVLTRYNYSGGLIDPVLNHNLTMIMDPKGQVYLKNEYGTDAQTRDRVVSQRFGSEDAPAMQIRYEIVQPAASKEGMASRTTVVDRLGVAKVYEHDARGLRLSGDGYRYRYDDHGLVVEELSPGNIHKLYEYDANGNVLRIAFAGADGTAFEQLFAYGPYDQIASHSLKDGKDERAVRFEFDAKGDRIARVAAGLQTQYVYNAKGQVIKEQSGSLAREFEYDGANPTVIRERASDLTRQTNITYDPMGYVKSVQDPSGSTTLYWADATGKVVQKRDALGTATYFRYDENGNPVLVGSEYRGGTAAEAIGPVLWRAYTYNVYDEPVVERTQVDKDRWEEQQKSYDAEGRLSEIKTADGVRYGYFSDENGRLVARTENGRLTLRRGYDADGRVIFEEDGLNNRQWWVRDGLGRVVRYVAPDGLQTLTSYAGLGDIASTKTYEIKDKTSRVVLERHYVYDEGGRVVRETVLDPGGKGYQQIDHTYENGRLAELRGPGGLIQKYTYDGFGRLVATEAADGKKVENRYGLRDELITRRTISKDRTIEMSWEYDALGRQVSARQNGVPLWALGYDSVGNVIKGADASGTESFFEVDGLGRMQKVTTQDRTRSFERDGRGLLAAIIDGDGQKTAFDYNDAARIKTRIDPDGVRSDYEYDVMGRVTALKRDGIEYGFQYNPLGAVTSRKARGFEQRFAYDASGRLTGMFDSNDPGTDADDVVVQRLYDGLGRIIVETVNGRTVTYAYDSRGSRERLIHPSGAKVDYRFGDSGELLHVALDGNALADFGYSAFGQRALESYANGSERSLIYDAFMRLTGEAAGTSAATRLYDYAYNYDAMGRVVQSRERAAGTWKAYQYDPLGRVIKVAGAVGDVKADAGGLDAFEKVLSLANERSEYTFSPEGDWQLVKQGGEETIKTGAGHRYEMFGDRSLGYDGRGNLKKYGNMGFEYDPWNRIKEVKRDGKTIATYIYDASNRRVAKVIGKDHISYSYDGWNVIEEFSGQQPTRQYVYGDGRDDPLAMVSAGKRYYYLRDRLGSVVAVADENSQAVERYEYGTFGQMRIFDVSGNELATSAIQNPITYTGQRYDDESGFYYYKNRYYSPQIGRFLTKDPIGMKDGPNLYSYVNNDPQNWKDPMGTDKGYCTMADAPVSLGGQTYLSAYHGDGMGPWEAYQKGGITYEEAWELAYEQNRFDTLLNYEKKSRAGTLTNEEYADWVGLTVQNGLEQMGYGNVTPATADPLNYYAIVGRDVILNDQRTQLGYEIRETAAGVFIDGPIEFLVGVGELASIGIAAQPGVLSYDWMTGNLQNNKYIQTSMALGSAAMHPDQALSAIVKSYEEKAQTPRGRGAIYFDVALLAAPILWEASGAVKAGKITAEAGDFVKAERAATAMGEAAGEMRVAAEGTKGGLLAKGGTFVRGTEEYAAAVKQGNTRLTQLVEKTKNVEPKQPVFTHEEVQALSRDAKPSFDTKLETVANEVKGKPITVDLKSSTPKGLERTQTKIRVDYAGDGSQLKDELRGSMVFENMDDLYASIPTIEKKYDIVKVKDRFAVPESNGYRDVNIVVRNENGGLAEIQLHVKPVYDAKQFEQVVSRDMLREVEKLQESDVKQILTKAFKDRSSEIYSEAWGKTDKGVIWQEK